MGMKGQITLKDIRRFKIQYNQDELDNISPDKINVWNKYVEMNDEKKILIDRTNKATLPYLVYGVKGTGKTLMVRSIAKELGWALVEIRCTDNTKERDLFGSQQLEGDTSYWNAGKLAMAFKGLKIYGKVIIFFDDIGNLPPEIQSSLLSLFDKRKSIDVAGQVFNVKEEEKLMIVCTTNPPIYAGVNPITEPLRSRLIGETRQYPTPQINKRTLDWSGIPIDEIQSPLLTVASTTNDLATKNHITYVLSPRDIEQFIEIYNDTQDVVLCINQTILIKYSDPTEKEQIRIRCQETFGVDI
jgi:MoxR-like ATPase